MGVVTGDATFHFQGRMMELAFEDFGHVLVTFEAQVVALADQDQFSNYTVAFVATFTIIVLEGFVGVFCPRRILLVKGAEAAGTAMAIRRTMRRKPVTRDLMPP